MRLHEWVFPLTVWRAMHGLEGGEENESARVVEESLVTTKRKRGLTMLSQTLLVPKYLSDSQMKILPKTTKISWISSDD